MDKKVIFLKRKTISVSVDNELGLIVRAPEGTSLRYIDEVLEAFAPRIERLRMKTAEMENIRKEATAEEEKQLRKRAKEILPEKVKYYSSLVGVSPLRITITSARTRFGSCSGKNSISFSFYLMRYPEEAIDYVVVHELCHILHHNHSKEFYKEVERVLPDYKNREKILKTYTGN